VRGGRLQSAEPGGKRCPPAREDVGTGLDAETQDVAADVGADAFDACPTVSRLGGDASPPSLADGGTIPGPPATQCSPSSTTQMNILWVNQSCAPIETWWVDFGCVEVQYGDVSALSDRSQMTLAGHRWRLREKGSHVLLREVAANADAAPMTYVFP
jgi:hypothetical protein